MPAGFAMHVLVAGCGWLGMPVAVRLLERGHRVTGVRRDPARAPALAAAGVEPLALDLAAPGAEARLPETDAIVACQSAASDSPEAYRAAYLEANRALLAAAARSGARALVYTGSTGVFGQRDGRDVDEDAEPSPAGDGPLALAEAERLVLGASGHGLRTSIVRLSGLYGPGRVGIAARVRSGALALGAGDDAWMNFCHLDDAASFVLAALERGRPGAVYHGSDAAPARRREVVEWIARRLGIVPPRSEAPATGPNRRILSERTREEIGVRLAWPSFRHGLAALVPAAAPE